MDTIDSGSRWPLTPGDGFDGPANAGLDTGATSSVKPRYPARTSGPAGPPPPGLVAGWLDRALRIVDEGPRPFYRAAVASLAVTSVLTVTTAELIRQPGPLLGTQRHIVIGALAALGLGAALGLASLAVAGRPRPATWLDRVVAPRERAAVWLALAAWFPFLLLVVYYRAKATFPPPVKYVYFRFDDKRWETAAYLLGVIAPVIWLTVAARVLTVGRGHPVTWRAWFTGLFPKAATVDPGSRAGGHAAGRTPRAARWPSSARTMLPVAAGLVTALGLAWYFTGPPWYLSQTSAPISHQEEVVLIGLQAVAKGHLPYVGVASVQYGPGTQVAAYWLMHHVTSFSVVGFRQAWTLFVWAGASVLFVVFFLAFGYLRGLAASLLSALVYPAFHLLAFQPDGSFDGYFGWDNPLRYAGVIALVLLLPAVVRRSPSWGGAAGGVAIGALWGLTSYLAQENLAGGAVGALAAGCLLLFTGTASWRALRSALVAVLGGFLLIWGPVLAYYAAHGQLLDFLQQYFLFPQAVASGANDTPFGGFGHATTPYSRLFHFLPFALAALALLAVIQVRPLRVATEWTKQRGLLVVAVLATALLYEGVLLRSDDSHLTGTELMVPALVIVTATTLPRLLGIQWRPAVAVVGVALFVASFALLPHDAFARASVHSWAQAPYLDRQHLAAGPPPVKPTTLAGARVGPGLDDAAQCCQGAPVSMPAFIHVMERIHTIVGDRTAYVANFHGEYPGLVYFTADLNPAPVPSDPYSSIETEPELKAFRADFRTTVLPQTQAVLTFTTKAPTAEYFLQRYPNARRVTLHFDRQPYYILLRRD
ncbi:MAG: hypothetical protein ACRDNW_13705 [Trebonia sp.]